MSAQSYAPGGFNDPFQFENPGSAPHSGNAWGSKISDAIGFTDDKAQYEQWLTNMDRWYERQSTNSARAWDEYFDSTKVQRLMSDIKAAGLNPWLALQSGLSTGGSSSTASSGSSARSVHSGNKQGNLIQSTAMMLLASAKLISLLAA